MSDEPRIFRRVVEVANLAAATRFNDQLLEIAGRPVRGSGIYYDCGGVILAVLDPSPDERQPQPNSGDVYFAVKDPESFKARAQTLACLANESLHGETARAIVCPPLGRALVLPN